MNMKAWREKMEYAQQNSLQ